MSSWKTARLEDVAEVLGGGTPSRQEPAYFGGSIAWATPTDVTALDSLYISTTKEGITEEGLNNSSTKLLLPGAVLLTSRATIGYTAVAQVPICTNQGFVNFICGTDLLPEFLAYWLRTQKEKMFQHAGGTTFKEIARSTLRKFEISFPSRDEQRQIVELLSRAEGIVRLRREAKKKAVEIIPALFLDMFGDPATNPKGWGLAPLGDHVFIPSVVRTPELERDGNHVCIGADSIESNTGVFLLCPTVRDVRPKSGKYWFEADDVLYSKIRPYLAKAAIARSAGYCSADMYPLRCRTTLRPRFLLALVLSRAFTEFATAESVRAQMPKLNREALFAYDLPLPPLALQDRFEALAASIEAIAAQQGAAVVKAESAFRTLLSRAFSGDLPVSALAREGAFA